MTDFERPAVVQTVMDFRQATATSEEIEAWRVDLADAEEGLEVSTETLKASEPWLVRDEYKARVKEIKERINNATALLTRSLANGGK